MCRHIVLRSTNSRSSSTNGIIAASLLLVAEPWLDRLRKYAHLKASSKSDCHDHELSFWVVHSPPVSIWLAARLLPSTERVLDVWCVVLNDADGCEANVHTQNVHKVRHCSTRGAATTARNIQMGWEIFFIKRGRTRVEIGWKNCRFTVSTRTCAYCVYYCATAIEQYIGPLAYCTKWNYSPNSSIAHRHMCELGAFHARTQDCCSNTANNENKTKTTLSSSDCLVSTHWVRVCVCVFCLSHLASTDRRMLWLQSCIERAKYDMQSLDALLKILLLVQNRTIRSCLVCFSVAHTQHWFGLFDCACCCLVGISVLCMDVCTYSQSRRSSSKRWITEKTTVLCNSCMKRYSFALHTHTHAHVRTHRLHS